MLQEYGISDILERGFSVPIPQVSDAGRKSGCTPPSIPLIPIRARISRHSQEIEVVLVDGLSITGLPFADDVGVWTSSNYGLELSLQRFSAECWDENQHVQI